MVYRFTGPQTNLLHGILTGPQTKFILIVVWCTVSAVYGSPDEVYFNSCLGPGAIYGSPDVLLSIWPGTKFILIVVWCTVNAVYGSPDEDYFDGCLGPCKWFSEEACLVHCKCSPKSLL